MSIILSLILVVALSLLATNIQAQNNGDIRLVNSGNSALDAFRGRLEVFIDGKWGTICGKSGTDFQAVADTACRQLRSKESTLYGTVTQLGFPVATDTTPIHFGSINCPSTSSDGICSNDYYQHVLRCRVDANVDTTTCTRDKDIGVACSTDEITSDTYESQVAIYGVKGENHPPSISLSSGILGIFFYKSSKPGLVCGKGFDKNAADTACRQLGYTNANYFNTSLQTTKQTSWDAGLECKSQSHSCLNDCFSKTPNNHTSCTNLVSLSCEFDLSRKNAESAGSPHQCDATVDNNCKPHNEDHTTAVSIVIIIIIVVVILAVIAVCTTCITLLVCCFVPGCLIHSKRNQRGPRYHHVSVTD